MCHIAYSTLKNIQGGCTKIKHQTEFMQIGQ